MCPLLTEEEQAALKKVQEEAANCANRGDFDLWCPAYKRLGFPLHAGELKFRIFCFHNAGGNQGIFTAGLRPDSANPFFHLNTESKTVELIALSYPGREKLAQVEACKDTKSLANAILPVILPKLTDGVPFVFFAHSVGSWVTTDLLMKMRQCGLTMPQALIVGSFPAPQMPAARYPWRDAESCSSAELQEEVKNWDLENCQGDALKMVFDPGMWSKTWEPLYRSDFALASSYTFEPIAPKWAFPVHAFWASKENYVKREMVEMWKELTTAEFTIDVLQDMGHLACVSNKELKKQFFQKVVDKIKPYIENPRIPSEATQVTAAETASSGAAASNDSGPFGWLVQTFQSDAKNVNSGYPPATQVQSIATKNLLEEVPGLAGPDSMSAIDTALVKLYVSACARKWSVLGEVTREATAAGASAAEVRQTLRLLIPHAGYTTALAAFKAVQSEGALPDKAPFASEERQNQTWEAIWADFAPLVLNGIKKLDAALGEWIPRTCYGEIIASPGLTMSQTELCFVGYLAGADLPDTLKGHLQALRRFGTGKDAATHAARLGLEVLLASGEERVRVGRSTVQQLESAYQ